MAAFRAHCTTSPLALPGSAAPVLVMVTSLWGAGGPGQVRPEGPRGDLSARWVWLGLLAPAPGVASLQPPGPLFPGSGRGGCDVHAGLLSAALSLSVLDRT